MITPLRRQDVVNAQLVEGYETGENPAGCVIHIARSKAVVFRATGPELANLGTLCGQTAVQGCLRAKKESTRSKLSTMFSCGSI